MINWNGHIYPCTTHVMFNTMYGCGFDSNCVLQLHIRKKSIEVLIEVHKPNRHKLQENKDHLSLVAASSIIPLDGIVIYGDNNISVELSNGSLLTNLDHQQVDIITGSHPTFITKRHNDQDLI